MLTPPSVTELATFSGRAAGTYSAYATQALAQATLLFEVLTGIKEYPTDPTLLQLVKNGILEWADFTYLQFPHQLKKSAPFQSQTIGSYSYSLKLEAAKKGNETGLFWFDLAVKKLKTKDVSEVGFGAISMDENDNVWQDGDGNKHFFGPEEERNLQYGYGPDDKVISYDPYWG